MKKIVVSAFSLFLLGVVSVQAQTTTGGQSTTQDQTTAQGATQGTTPSGTQAGAASGTQAGTSTSTGTATQTDATNTGAAAGTAAPGTAATGTSATGTTATSAAAGTTVTLEELPAPVKATLASEKLKTWTPSSAQLVKDATTGKEYYSIELKQANQIGTVKIGKDGKPVK
ncbi:hypothetical protein AHMF7605_19655 [Adhaeribacter arboris]|uniref:PepSY domain-containing protein n=1 Tax=Adhaeribacter arboris TaxID=2072846 RepID=A0A2T2YJ75_9BACT|nr:hypothetical protein [Adhaeribacter arboris]PSR55563.1 hypothetical protein AHMF7605_19655 [Adhaeribacter arboris]